MKLYELNEKFILIQDKLERGELTEEQVADTLESLDMAFKDKVENTVKMIRTFEAEEKALKEESYYLKEKAIQAKKRAENLKNYLDYIMQAQNLDELKAGNFKLNYRKRPASVEIIDEAKLPRAYKRTIIKVEPDKKKIKQAIQDGEEVLGAKLVDDKYTLQIK